jgi:hypothetical protein
MSKLTVEDVNRANAREGNITYQHDTILPRCRKMEQKLNEVLLPMYDDKLFCAFDNPVGEDKEFRLKERESNLKTGYTSINEERLEDNQEPVSWGEVPWLPMNLVPAGTDLSSSLSPSLGGGGASRAPAALKGKFIDPDELPEERQTLVNIVQQMFKLQAQEVLSNMPKSAGSLKLLEDFWLPDNQRWTGWLAEKSRPAMIRLVKKGAARAASKLQIGPTFIPSAPEIAEFVSRHAYKFSFAVNAETEAKLRTYLSEGLQAGENVYDLRKRVQATFKNMADYRAERIGRTESGRAMNAGMELGWQKSQLVEAKEWSGASDMCEFCRTMNDMYGPGTGGIPLGHTFVNQGEHVEGIDGGDLSADYGPIEYPPLHPHCRCDLLPVLKDLPPED